MCEYLSFALAVKDGELRVFTDPQLESHDGAIELYSLTGLEIHEAEWDDDDQIEIRLTEGESESRAKFYEDWIRSRWASRQLLVNQQCMEHLQANRMPNMFHFEHPNWNDRTMRLFACDCAEHVIHICEKDFPDEKRPRQAIEVARRFARGEATKEELAAARDAAWDAARAAARAAETSWQIQRLMQYLNGELS